MVYYNIAEFDALMPSLVTLDMVHACVSAMSRNIDVELYSLEDMFNLFEDIVIQNLPGYSHYNSIIVIDKKHQNVILENSFFFVTFACDHCHK